MMNNYARVVIVVWMFVVLILTSTYTASLSARLTVQRLQPEHIQKGDYVGCRKGSFIYNLLQEIGHEKSRIRTYKHFEDIDEALTKGSGKGGTSTFFAVKPYTDLFISKHCDKYTTDGPTYPNEGYAFVFVKGSPLVADVSRAIIELTESGKLSDIEAQLTKSQNCKEQDLKDNYSIRLENFQVLFAFTGATTATCVIVFLVTYVYENRDLVTKISSPNATIWEKVRALSINFDQRDPSSFRKNREDEENTLSSRRGNSGSGSVVPVSSEMDDFNEDSSPHPEHANPTG